MKLYHASYLIFHISGKNFKLKEIIIRILITAIFAFSCFAAIKITVSVEIFRYFVAVEVCVKALGNHSVFHISRCLS